MSHEQSGFIGRRTFLGSVAASSARVLGASDRLRAALIGCGGRGCYLVREFRELGVETVAVCDVYEPNLQAGMKAAAPGAKAYEDYRRMLDDRGFEVVIIATPDHWHAQMMIDAVDAGMDVYLEKPMAHTIEEGFRMVDAVRRTRRVVQVGTQRRSFDLYREAKDIVDSGVLGQIRLVNNWWLNRERPLRQGKLEGRLDWDKWLGPAPKRPLDLLRFFNWRYFWDYSGGMMVGQTAHTLDSVQWLMNSTYPSAVTASAAPAGLEGAEVPETTCMTVEYPEKYLAVFTVGYMAMRYEPFNDQMIQFHGTKARLDLGRESYELYPEAPKEIDMKPSREKRSPGEFFKLATAPHVRNFLECVRLRKTPISTVEMGQSTNVALCMAMESVRTGRRLRWNGAERRAAG